MTTRERARGRERTALHEAGHAVAALALGISIESARASEYGGETRFFVTPAEIPPAAALVVSVAGAAAEQLAVGATDVADDDRAWAERSAFELVPDLDGLDDVLERAKAVALELLTHRWRMVNAVALALLQAGGNRVSGEELGRHCPALAVVDVEELRDRIVDQSRDERSGDRCVRTSGRRREALLSSASPGRRSLVALGGLSHG